MAETGGPTKLLDAIQAAWMASGASNPDSSKYGSAAERASQKRGSQA